MFKTHRCHKKEFLLKFERDRKQWLKWLYEAKKRFDLCVLNYIVTSNRIHLVVYDTGTKSISSSMQLIAGRTAQQFNLRKKRKGAYWSLSASCLPRHLFIHEHREIAIMPRQFKPAIINVVSNGNMWLLSREDKSAW